MESAITSLRDKVLQELSWIEHQVEKLALQIDEEQLNEFVLNDLDPAPVESDDEDESNSSSSSSSSSSSGPAANQTRSHYDWENFAQWSFDIDNRNEKKMAHEFMDSNDLTDTSSSTASTMEEVVAAEPDTDDEEAQHVATITRYAFAEAEAEIDTSFLHQIAKEAVNYETDSEAVDSWAQDSDSAHLSGSSGAGISYDPARFALAEIMNSSRYNAARNRMEATEESGRAVRPRVTWNLPEAAATTEQHEDSQNQNQTKTSRRTSKMSIQGLEIVSAFPEDFDRDGWVSFEDDESVSSFRLPR